MSSSSNVELALNVVLRLTSKITTQKPWIRAREKVSMSLQVWCKIIPAATTNEKNVSTVLVTDTSVLESLVCMEDLTDSKVQKGSKCQCARAWCATNYWRSLCIKQHYFVYADAQLDYAAFHDPETLENRKTKGLYRHQFGLVNM